jgi:hypothetical protein
MTVNEIMHDLSYLSPVTLFAGCVIGMIGYTKISPMGKLIFWYLASMLCIDIVARYWANSASYNLFLLSVAGLTDLFFFSWLYVKYFQVSFRIPLLTISSLVGLAVLTTTVFYNSHKMIAEFQSYDKVACDSVLFIYALISMLDLLRGKGEVKREIVRVNVAVLLYFSLDMLISLIINFLVNAGLNFLVYFWLLRLALLLTLYIILIYTLWQTGKNPKRWQYG